MSTHLIHMAAGIATVAHQGQTDKVGEPYIEHPVRVARHVECMTASALGLTPQQTEYAIAAAWLHDTIEDTTEQDFLWVTEESLVDLGFPAEVVEAVVLLTFTGETEEEREAYYAAIKPNPIALAVKFGDLIDNSNPERRARLPERLQTKFKARYEKAAECLGLMNPFEWWEVRAKSPSLPKQRAGS